jgi:hypothetical protein
VLIYIYIVIESWEQKGKFPLSLKPPLANLAILAIKLDEYDNDFFALMPMLFPYNKFTMTVRVLRGLCYPSILTDPPHFRQKLIKRTIFADYLALLIERQDALLLAQLT